jgi:hypothetical protein
LASADVKEKLGNWDFCLQFLPALEPLSPAHLGSSWMQSEVAKKKPKKMVSWAWMVVYVCNSSTWEAEIRRIEVQRQFRQINNL